jgi:hypothetical protein
MGLLDFLQGGNTKPLGQGLLAAGLGMLANNRGGVSTAQALGQGGLLGMNAYANTQQSQLAAQEAATKEAYTRQQMAQADVETQMKQQQFNQSLAQQQALNDAGNYLITGQLPGAAAGAAAGTAGAAPAAGGNVPGMLANPFQAPTGSALAGATSAPTGTSGSSGTGGQPNGQTMQIIQMVQGLPDQLKPTALALIRAGDLKGLGDLLKPNLKVNERSGVVVDLNTGQPVSYTPTFQNGVPMTLGKDASGQLGSSILPGGLENLAQTKSVDSSFAPATMIGPNNTTVATNQGYLLAHPGTQTGLSPVDTANQQMYTKNFIDSDYNPTIAAGQNAEGQLANITALRNLPQGGGGWGADAKAKAAAVGGWLGIPGADAVAANQQMFQSVAGARLQQLLASQKGPQTENDAKRAAATFAQYSNTPQANAFIYDMAQAVAEQQKLQQQFYQKGMSYAQQHNLPTYQIPEQWEQVQQSVWANPVMQKWIPKDPKGQ